MYKLFIVMFAVSSYVFAGSLNETVGFNENSNPVKNQYSWANGSSDDDNKLEAGRRRGKQNRGDRRRGGGGLR